MQSVKNLSLALKEDLGGIARGSQRKATKTLITDSSSGGSYAHNQRKNRPKDSSSEGSAKIKEADFTSPAKLRNSISSSSSPSSAPDGKSPQINDFAIVIQDDFVMPGRNNSI